MDTSSFERSLIDRARKAAHTRFRVFDDAAVAIPGGLFAHVVSGKVKGFGIEPLGDAIVALDDRLTVRDESRGRMLWGKVAATAGSAAALAAATAGAVAATVIHFRRRTA
jgi:hypothetical protein